MRVRAASRSRQEAVREARHHPGPAPLLAHYTIHPLSVRDIFVLLLPGITAFLVPLGYGMWRAEYAYASYGPVAAEHWSRPWYVLAITAVLIFLLLGLYRLNQSLVSVRVYRRGISVRTGFRRARSFSWHDFQGLTTSVIHEHFFGLPINTRYQTSLILHSGETLKLPHSLRNLPELISRLKAKLYPRLMPKLQAEFQQGEWLEFGPLAIQSEGMRMNKREYAWRQVKHLDVQGGKLVIEFNDRPGYTIPVGQIPNLELVLQLIDQGIQ